MAESLLTRESFSFDRMDLCLPAVVQSPEMRPSAKEGMPCPRRLRDAVCAISTEQVIRAQSLSYF